MEAQRIQTRLLTLIGLIATAVSLLAVLLFVRTITSRLSVLVLASDRISRGEFDKAVPHFAVCACDENRGFPDMVAHCRGEKRGRWS